MEGFDWLDGGGETAKAFYSIGAEEERVGSMHRDH